MSNRVIVKLGFIAIIFGFASCHNDVPNLPSSDEVKEYKYCKYGNDICKNTYEISEQDCRSISGELFLDKDCTEPYTKEPDPGEAEE
ncbi:MAG: hypothetical protein FWF63_01675 [Fibromonadales bacterium]|nr:hypothetical protein [Fibromonadales bacterium]